MTGTMTLLRFMLRRERIGLPCWLLGVTALVLIQSGQSQALYGDPGGLDKLRHTLGGNTAAVAMNGPTGLLATIGGEVVFEIFGFAAIVVALMSMMLIGRHTRADEEAGRAELVRSARVGRRAPLAAALLLAGLADVAAGVLVSAVAIATGLPAGGSVLFGAALAGAGLTFTALTALVAQIFESTRTVYGVVAALLGLSYALRAAGDTGDGTLSWFSPIGWGQRSFPYAGDRWWALLLPSAAVALLGAGAVALHERRDAGAGLVAPRPGPARAARSLRNAYALAWRLQRGALVGWAAGLALLGVAYGSIGTSIEQYVADNPEVADFLPGGEADLIDGYLALTVGVSALLAAAYGVSSTMRLRAEETAGRAEPVLATATGRLTWLASHLSVALAGSALVLLAIGAGEGLAYGLNADDIGQLPRVIGVALAQLPAVWLVIATVVLAIGWWPRRSAVLGWVVVGYCAVIALFADSFGLPDWAGQASPFAHTPQVPLERLTVTPPAVLVAAAAAFVAAGCVGLRRRDTTY